MKNIFLILILFAATINPQNAEYLNSIGDFQQAASFSINSGGYIYVTDFSTDEIYKLDTLGNQIKFAGGFGWGNGSFDKPAFVFATALTIYVADKNNNRIQRFDKDLNFISLLNTRENNNNSSFGYPTGCAVSSQGDLYVLDSENNKIVAFDMFGNFNQSFGGFDDGEFSVNSPFSIAISPDRRIFVLDSESIYIYDQFGNGIIKFDNDKNLKKLNITFNNFITVNETEVFYNDLRKISPEKKINLSGNEPDGIVEGLIFNQKLYILTTNKIHVYSFESE